MAAEEPFTAMSTGQLSASLQLNLAKVELIQRNPYCDIWRAEADGQPVILKQYRPQHTNLAEKEAEALRAWSAFARTRPEILPTDCLAHQPAHGTLAIEFVPGMRLSDMLYAAKRNPQYRAAAIHACSQLGNALADWRLTSVGAAIAPLSSQYTDYTLYLGRRLRGLLLLGPTVFHNAENAAEKLVADMQAQAVVPGRTHGDFVFRNIHVHDGRVGLIDFANSLHDGYPLDDVWNLWHGLHAMMIDRSLKNQAWEAFAQPVRTLDLSPALSNFFREYHRRRWLMLRLISRNPKSWLDAARGALLFAGKQTAL